MAEAKSLSEIVNANFSWPEVGGQTLVESDDPFANAVVAAREYSRRGVMSAGYKKAGDILVDASEADRATRDFLVFPVIFNYRHFLELELKNLIAIFGPSAGVQPIWNSHDLVTLWNVFFGILGDYGIETNESDQSVHSTVLEFARIDLRSDSFRYPLNSRGLSFSVPVSRLHLPTLKAKLDAVSNYFAGCEGYLSALHDTP